uniref:Uncharacterized protein n=1 Tax=Amphimedon queenslandica TaxID=400682 RepID=A0A1X7V5P3_AMPQE
MAGNDTCVNGLWEDGVCVCDPRYELGFNELELNPKYCLEEKVTVIAVIPYVTGEELVHTITIGLTVFLATWAILSFLALLMSIKDMSTIHTDLQVLNLELEEFVKENEKYPQAQDMMDATLWEPPRHFKCLETVDVM